MTVVQLPERGRRRKSRELDRVRLHAHEVALIRAFADSHGISLDDAVARLIRMALKSWTPLQ